MDVSEAAARLLVPAKVSICSAIFNASSTRTEMDTVVRLGSVEVASQWA